MPSSKRNFRDIVNFGCVFMKIGEGRGENERGREGEADERADFVFEIKYWRFLCNIFLKSHNVHS